MAVDPGDDTHLDNPQSWNRYSYARNNTIKFIDPNGEIVQLAVGNYTDGNVFGHVAIVINDRVFSFGTTYTGASDWGVSARAYLAAQGSQRETTLLSLAVTPEQEMTLQQYLEANVPNDANYWIVTGYTCVGVTEHALEAAGILNTIQYTPAGTGDTERTSRVTHSATPSGIEGRVQNQTGLVAGSTTVGNRPSASKVDAAVAMIKSKIRRVIKKVG